MKFLLTILLTGLLTTSTNALGFTGFEGNNNNLNGFAQQKNDSGHFNYDPNRYRGYTPSHRLNEPAVGSGHIYVTPDANTQLQDYMDQKSLRSSKPNPWANDPRNNFQNRRKEPRGYIFQY